MFISVVRFMFCGDVSSIGIDGSPLSLTPLRSFETVAKVEALMFCFKGVSCGSDLSVIVSLGFNDVFKLVW